MFETGIYCGKLAYSLSTHSLKELFPFSPKAFSFSDILLRTSSKAISGDYFYEGGFKGDSCKTS